MGFRAILGSMSNDCICSLGDGLFGWTDNMGIYEHTISKNIIVITGKSSSLIIQQSQEQTIVGWGGGGSE